MSARKLGRLAGLAFVLVAVFGGVSVAAGAEHETGGGVTAARFATLEHDWA